MKRTFLKLAFSGLLTGSLLFAGSAEHDAFAEQGRVYTASTKEHRVNREINHNHSIYRQRHSAGRTTQPARVQ